MGDAALLPVHGDGEIGLVVDDVGRVQPDGDVRVFRPKGFGQRIGETAVAVARLEGRLGKG